MDQQRYVDLPKPYQFPPLRVGSRYFPAPWQDRRRVTVTGGFGPGQFDFNGTNADVFVVRFLPPSSPEWNPKLDPSLRPILAQPLFRMWMSLRWYRPGTQGAIHPVYYQAIASADSLDGKTWQLAVPAHIQFTGPRFFLPNVGGPGNRGDYAYEAEIVIPREGEERRGNETFSAVWHQAQQKWFGYYTAFPGKLVLGPGESGRWYDIYLATTSDPNGLRNWRRQGVVLSPELDPGHWEGGRFLSPYPELIHGGGLSEPSVLFDGSRNLFLMWYANLHNGVVRPEIPAQIGLATSVDGRNWMKNPNNPVLRVGPEGSWDENAVTHCHVVEDPLGGYHMFYHGNGSNPATMTPGGAIGHAFSFDGVTWYKNPANPILSPPILAEGARQYLGPSALIVDNVWRLYYWERDIDPVGQATGAAKIGYAEASRALS